MVTTQADASQRRDTITHFLRYVSAKPNTKAGRIITSTRENLGKIDFEATGYLAENARAEVMNAKLRLIDALAVTSDVSVCRNLVNIIGHLDALHTELGATK